MSGSALITFSLTLCRYSQSLIGPLTVTRNGNEGQTRKDGYKVHCFTVETFYGTDGWLIAGNNG